MPRMEVLWVKCLSRHWVQCVVRMGHLALSRNRQAGAAQGCVQATLLQDLQRRRLCGPMQVLSRSIPASYPAME